MHIHMTLWDAHVFSHVERQIKVFIHAQGFIPAQLLQAQEENYYPDNKDHKFLIT